MAKAVSGDTETKVEVILKHGNFLVRVFSVVKPGLISSGWVSKDAENIHVKVMAMGGAIAEHQCEKYLDHHDPDGVAHAAGVAFTELMAKLREQVKP